MFQVLSPFCTRVLSYRRLGIFIVVFTPIKSSDHYACFILLLENGSYANPKYYVPTNMGTVV